MEPIMSLNWSAVALAASVASPACAAHAVARSQARTRVGCGARRSMAGFVAVGAARKLSHNDPMDRDPSATVSTNVGEEMQRGALLLAAGGALSPSFAPVTFCPRAGCEQHAPSEAAGPSYITADCSQVLLAVVLLDALLRRKICLPPADFTRCSNLACKLPLRRW